MSGKGELPVLASNSHTVVAVHAWPHCCSWLLFWWWRPAAVWLTPPHCTAHALSTTRAKCPPKTTTHTGGLIFRTGWLGTNTGQWVPPSIHSKINRSGGRSDGSEIWNRILMYGAHREARHSLLTSPLSPAPPRIFLEGNINFCYVLPSAFQFAFLAVAPLAESKAVWWRRPRK